MAVKSSKTEKCGKQREEFIADNLNLVHSLAHRYTGRGIDYDDLYSAGCVGLVKAYDGFDESLGYSFSTYAVPVILGEIRRLFRDGGSVKVSRSLKDLSMKVTAEQARLEHELMRAPTVKEIAEAVGAQPEEVTQALEAAMPAMSLTVSDDGGEHEMDLPVEDSEEQMIKRIALTQAMSRLEPNDRKLIWLRYFRDKTQTQTAQLLNMTQVSVSRREKVILTELKRSLSE